MTRRGKINASVKQRGVVLVMGLIMLVVMTLIAVTAINMTTTSIQVVGNAQFRQEAMAAGQKAIETVISSNSFKSTAPTVQTIDVTMDGAADYKVTFTPAPVCKYFEPVDTSVSGLPSDCYGSVANLCYWTLWDITAVVEDNTAGSTGAQVTLHQGVRTIAGMNATLTSCGT